MSVARIEIDLIELADIGQPTKIAHEIHRQLRKQLGAVPNRLPLAPLAEAVGIAGIKEFDTNQFEGTLVIKDGAGAIGLRRGLRPGRRNFTLGHEIGHFLIPNHRFQRTSFMCATSDMNKRRAGGNWADRPPLEGIEIEANEFSAALLAPLPEYREARRRLGSGCDVSHVRQLADIFAVSHEMMAQLYVNQTDEKAAIIISQDGIVRRVITPANFPFLGLRSGSPLPPKALARTFTSAKGQVASDLCEVLTDRWLEERGSVSAIYEQVVLQQAGWATTLLVVDEEEIDDEGDDRDWNRRNYHR
jgi:Zn-dependent peptidase ImmA (M78 family)